MSTALSASDGCSPEISDPHQIDFSFHRMTANQCRLSTSLEKENAAKHVATYKSRGGARVPLRNGDTSHVARRVQ